MPTGIIQSDCNHFYLTNRETEALARLRPKEPTVSQILEQLSLGGLVPSTPELLWVQRPSNTLMWNVRERTLDTNAGERVLGQPCS